MHVQIVTFRLDGLDEDAYREDCARLAPVFAEVPGLLAKIWLNDPASGTYGGVYLFADRESADEYGRSELGRAVAGHPHFRDMVARRFDVYEDLTRVTHGAAVIPPVAAA